MYPNRFGNTTFSFFPETKIIFTEPEAAHYISACPSPKYGGCAASARPQVTCASGARFSTVGPLSTDTSTITQSNKLHKADEEAMARDGENLCCRGESGTSNSVF